MVKLCCRETSAVFHPLKHKQMIFVKWGMGGKAPMLPNRYRSKVNHTCKSLWYSTAYCDKTSAVYNDTQRFVDLSLKYCVNVMILRIFNVFHVHRLSNVEVTDHDGRVYNDLAGGEDCGMTLSPHTKIQESRKKVQLRERITSPRFELTHLIWKYIALPLH